MKALVIGTGGREHALAWRLSLSPSCSHVFLHPGNAGTRSAELPHFDGVGADDIDGILQRARAEHISLVVIGPEALLEKGWADKFRNEGFAVCGPGQESARLESSKIFAKEFMKRAGIPTADFRVAEDPEQLKLGIEQSAQWPQVIKLDGLAAGKGVCVAKDAAEATAFADRIWGSEDFGPGPHRVLLEDFLPGREISYIVVTDGQSYVPMASATDYKPVGDGNTGPNTGGMGCVSPSPFMHPELEKKIQSRIVEPALKQLQQEKLPYRGVLYCGLMINEDQEPSVVEFNARFGDPETQVTTLRLKSDFGMLLLSAADGQLRKYGEAQWTDQQAIFVVGAAEGYPLKVRKGDSIGGLDQVHGATVFFAGVNEQDGALVTHGGRVLGVGALGDSLESARESAYQNLKKIRWEGMHYRTDIGT